MWTHAYLPAALPPRKADGGMPAPLAAAALAIAPHAGVIVLGIGDAMASLVGVYAGRTRWPRSQKTLEGSGAALVAMLLAMFLILDFGSATGVPFDVHAWAALGTCAASAALLEAVTDQIDNLFLPVGLQTCLIVAARRG